jgi:hypothetical protein
LSSDLERHQRLAPRGGDQHADRQKTEQDGDDVKLAPPLRRRNLVDRGDGDMPLPLGHVSAGQEIAGRAEHDRRFEGPIRRRVEDVPREHFVGRRDGGDQVEIARVPRHKAYRAFDQRG